MAAQCRFSALQKCPVWLLAITFSHGSISNGDLPEHCFPTSICRLGVILVGGLEFCDSQFLPLWRKRADNVYKCPKWLFENLPPGPDIYVLEKEQVMLVSASHS